MPNNNLTKEQTSCCSKCPNSEQFTELVGFTVQTSLDNDSLLEVIITHEFLNIEDNASSSFLRTKSFTISESDLVTFIQSVFKKNISTHHQNSQSDTQNCCSHENQETNQETEELFCDVKNQPDDFVASSTPELNPGPEETISLASQTSSVDII